MLIGYVRVSKSDGSQTLAPQHDAMLTAGVEPGRIYQDLASGRLDYVQADILAMNDFVASETGAACCKVVGEVPADPAVLGAGVGVGMRQGEPDLKKRVDDAIAAIMADGTFDALTKPVFGDMNIKPAAQ